MSNRDLYVVVKHTNETACVVCYSLDEADRWIRNDYNADWGGYKAQIKQEIITDSPYKLILTYQVISPYSHMVMATYYLYRKTIDVEKLILFS